MEAMFTKTRDESQQRREEKEEEKEGEMLEDSQINNTYFDYCSSVAACYLTLILLSVT